MAEVTAALVKELRERTGAGMMDCKKALTECGGEMEKACDFLREKGLAAAAKKGARVAAEGTIESYIHGGGRIGVLLEVNCETDFVARGDEFKALVRDIGMHIAAANPQYLSKEEVPADVLQHERDILKAQALNEGKPEKIIEKMVEGRIEKYYKEVCLLEQAFVKDPDKSISELVLDKTAKIGERIVIRRFTRYELGAGIEKRQDDFAAEVMKELNR
ncbi:translation elongation factor Ts [Desulfosporosinus sp.]|uniref:translation elongation factor Ts n=1 Tax=Desulfosporosinus sp. TaxID=157907 RepID=UPI000E85341D|nr:translation elongation factor Ts [Desulfosporosinus sp.]MBC2722488.1 translation elongation factor Ts [Desulfosporosinus sp.]MBC2728287.1 translation elongation factor Ts [Desulfosporosinus sp.]HBV87356.1 elongation factor Ts [Desulfosporosinus sp.]